MTDINQYANFVAHLAKNGNLILSELDPTKVAVCHMVAGVCGEAGEILRCAFIPLSKNEDVDKSKLIGELGDIEFYLEGLKQAIRVTDTSSYERSKSNFTDIVPADTETSDTRTVASTLSLVETSCRLTDYVKKIIVYNKQLDLKHIVGLIKDIEKLLEDIRNDLGLTREQIVTHNMDKLKTRFKVGDSGIPYYSDSSAIKRPDTHDS